MVSWFSYQVFKLMFRIFYLYFGPLILVSCLMRWDFCSVLAEIWNPISEFFHKSSPLLVTLCEKNKMFSRTLDVSLILFIVPQTELAHTNYNICLPRSIQKIPSARFAGWMQGSPFIAFIPMIQFVELSSANKLNLLSLLFNWKFNKIWTSWLHLFYPRDICSMFKFEIKHWDASHRGQLKIGVNMFSFDTDFCLKLNLLK